MKIIFLYFLCCVTLSLALPLVQDADLTPKKSIPFGFIIGDILVDSGNVVVGRRKPQKKTDGPSHSAFQAGAGISISSGGGSQVGEDGNKHPVQINGATLVFNNEAAISEINA